MKIPTQAKPELVAYKGDGRYILVDPWLDVENKAIVATDGRHIVVLPVIVEDGDTSGRVTADALKAARKLARKGETASIACNGGYKFDDGATMPRPMQRPDDCKENYPNWQQVMPRAEEDGVSIAFDARLLANMQQAFGSEFVTITLRGEKPELGVIAVRPSGTTPFAGQGAKGALMPARLS